MAFLPHQKETNANGDNAVTQRPAEKTSILVVDDELAVRDALKLVLEANGYEALLAETGRAAIAQVHTRVFQVLIVDLDLPDTSGLELIKTIRELQPATAVILITAQVTADALVQTQSLGAVQVLSKPFPPEDLLQLVRKVHSQSGS